MKSKFEIINDSESPCEFLVQLKTIIFEVDEFLETLNEMLKTQGLQYVADRFNSRGCGNLYDKAQVFHHSGIECRILNPNDSGGWRNGKLRVKVYVEFCPDEPEVEDAIASAVSTSSPLDEIRQFANP